jgi:hypothetical protein
MHREEWIRWAGEPAWLADDAGYDQWVTGRVAELGSNAPR